MDNRAVFRIRRGTNHEWVTKNPVLHEGEPSYEEDTGRLKFGDGRTRWVDLDYIIPEKDVKAAIAGLRRKTATPAERHARSLAYIKGRMKKATQLCAGRTFTLADAKALGFCDYGIRSWCHRAGIDPDGQATIEQIIAGYKSAPVAEARQFILHYCR